MSKQQSSQFELVTKIKRNWRRVSDLSTQEKDSAIPLNSQCTRRGRHSRSGPVWCMRQEHDGDPDQSKLCLDTCERLTVSKRSEASREEVMT
jgi:hypothetical protein